MTIAARFAPNEDLAAALLPEVMGQGGDTAHDLSHILRVWTNVQAIRRKEGGDTGVLTAATLLHDCVHVPKDSPLRSSASRLAAERAAEVLRAASAEPLIDAVFHAIHAHSFSAGIVPETLEARILQDADRLDAIGHIGIARCFAVAGQMGSALYDPQDPNAAARPLDDRAFALDHFKAKLLKLADGFQTRTGRALAAGRHATVQRFLQGMLAEIAPPGPRDESA